MALVQLMYMLLIAASQSHGKAAVRTPSECNRFPCLIFEDNFDELDIETWEHEITMSGGGNWEFQLYQNNRSNSYTRDGKLFIKPMLLEDKYSPGFVKSGSVNLWGMNGVGDVCTGHSYSGCERKGNGVHYLSPVTSARLRTLNSFAFRYGRVEVRAKMPAGDWLWPAIWMLPRGWPYGQWPASGEIDIVESRGNRNLRAPDGQSNGQDVASSTVHWGPYWPEDRWWKTHKSYRKANQPFGEFFHTWRLDWTKDNMRFYVDDELQLVVDPTTNFFDYGGWNGKGLDNPWQGRAKMAPFDQPFYIVMNVAVGGVNGFFNDAGTNSPHRKPWSNGSGQAFKDFYDQKHEWYPTWTDDSGRVGESAAMQVDYVRVWKMRNTDE